MNIQDTKPVINYNKIGRDISGQAQDAFFAHLGGAIKNGGVSFAIDYCNLNGVSIVDSLNNTFNCTISRVSEKNRNPVNALSGDTEKAIWDDFKKNRFITGRLDTIINSNGKVVYYKIITIEMPTCLSCHGDPDTYMQPEILSKINKLYPDDKARNYKINDIGGLWKIEFN